MGNKYTLTTTDLRDKESEANFHARYPEAQDLDASHILSLILAVEISNAEIKFESKEDFIDYRNALRKTINYMTNYRSETPHQNRSMDNSRDNEIIRAYKNGIKITNKSTLKRVKEIYRVVKGGKYRKIFKDACKRYFRRILYDEDYYILK